MSEGKATSLHPVLRSDYEQDIPWVYRPLEASDEKTGGDLVYALMLWDEEDAVRLGTLLGGKARD